MGFRNFKYFSATFLLNQFDEVLYTGWASLEEFSRVTFTDSNLLG